MSEKRILIKEVTAPCDNCCGAGENVCDKCHDWYMWQSSSTREQAIEKMAKAMADVSNITYVSEEQWKVVENGFRISAEVALNALLEGKK